LIWRPRSISGSMPGRHSLIGPGV